MTNCFWFGYNVPKMNKRKRKPIIREAERGQSILAQNQRQGFLLKRGTDRRKRFDFPFFAGAAVEKLWFWGKISRTMSIAARFLIVSREKSAMQSAISFFAEKKVLCSQILNCFRRKKYYAVSNIIFSLQKRAMQSDKSFFPNNQGLCNRICPIPGTIRGRAIGLVLFSNQTRAMQPDLSFFKSNHYKISNIFTRKYDSRSIISSHTFHVSHTARRNEP